MTAKTFVEMQLFWVGHNLMNPHFNQNVPMLYFGQVIKLPYEMPCYEALCYKSLAFVMEESNDPVYMAVHDMDSTGERVLTH